MPLTYGQMLRRLGHSTPQPYLARMAENPTIAELYRVKLVTGDEIAAAVESFMRKPASYIFQFASGYSVDLSAAVNAHAKARTIFADQQEPEARRLAHVELAILLARPVKA